MEMPKYFEPNNAGLNSEPRAAGRRVARLLDTLSTEVNGYICGGYILEEVRNLRMSIIENMRAQGWRVTVKSNDRYSVLPPKEVRK